MPRTTGILSTMLTLSIAGGIAAVAAAHHPAATKGKEMITCPIMKSKVEKSKAIAVKTQSGKTVYVCCKSCVTAAKKLK
jgi:phosphoribosyl-dephospho-CoA transferase